MSIKILKTNALYSLSLSLSLSLSPFSHLSPLSLSPSLSFTVGKSSRLRQAPFSSVFLAAAAAAPAAGRRQLWITLKTTSTLPTTKRAGRKKPSCSCRRRYTAPSTRRRRPRPPSPLPFPCPPLSPPPLPAPPDPPRYNTGNLGRRDAPITNPHRRRSKETPPVVALVPRRLRGAPRSRDLSR